MAIERVAYRGKTATELNTVSPADYLKMVKSRQRRSMKRNGIDYKKLLAKVEKYKAKGLDKPIRTQVREAMIIPSWIGLKFAVHNGKEFMPLLITANMLGHRLGEYSYSTKPVRHSAPGIRATRGSKFLAVK
jgi:small subunit ribosomal protein S19